MKDDREAVLFSLKCFAAAMIAYYLSLQIGLTKPYWAIGTCYIVSQTSAGASISRGLFRFIGTFIGGAATVVLVPTFANEPMVLSIALASWIGFCLYLSLLDRTPRAYAFVLAGYTASLIGFPSVATPGASFDIAALRVQEISIGILCASLVHGFILPRRITDRFHARLSAIMADAERSSRHALAGTPDAAVSRDRRKLAADLLELHQLSIHLPFDLALSTPHRGTLQMLHDRLSLVLPRASAVEDWLAEARAMGLALPGELADLIARTERWLGPSGDGNQGQGNQEQEGDALAAAIAPLSELPATPVTAWHALLFARLASSLADLIAAHRACRILYRQLNASAAPALPADLATEPNGSGYVFHRDHWLAARAGLGTILGISLGCAFWIATAWSDGATAVSILGVSCALFGNVDAPAGNIIRYLVGSLAGVAIGMVYSFVILPRVTDFVTLAAVLAPTLLFLGSMQARPAYTFTALGALLTFPIVSGLGATNVIDFPSFINGSIALLLGSGFSVVCVSLFQTVGVDTAIGRLLRAGWRDVANHALGRAGGEMRWTGRMVDRTALLVPRLAARGAAADDALVDTILDLRAGAALGKLRGMAITASPAVRDRTDVLLAAIAAHFRALTPTSSRTPAASTLAQLDALLQLIDGEPDATRRNGLPLLADLRHDLFPAAPAYRMAPA